MADNKPVRDGDNATFTGAADELSDGSFSPKISLLDGSGSPSPISPPVKAQFPPALTGSGNLRVSVSEPAPGQRNMSASVPVVIASDQTPLPITLTPPSSTAAQTSVAGSTASVTILAANAARRGAAVFNESTAILYLRLASGTASATAYTVQLVAGAYYEVPYSYTGALVGVWATAAGAARVTEFS